MVANTTRNPVTQYVEGTIARANDRGLIFEGAGDRLNVSRFADNPPEIPDVGLMVRVGLDKDRFIRTITVLDTPAELQRRRVDEPRPAGGAVDRETRISRQACLNSALTLFGLRPDESPTLESVLAVAEAMEHWVAR